MKPTWCSLLLLIAACVPQEDGTGEGRGPSVPDEPEPAAIAPTGGTPTVNPPAGACADLPDCVDADSLPVQWTIGTGQLSRIPDVDGDGLSDLTVRLDATGETSVLVLAPHAVVRTDVKDAIATASNGLYAIGDLTGDGEEDFARGGLGPAAGQEDQPTEAVPGPIVGDIDDLPAVSPAPEGSEQDFTDRTGDGIGNRMTSEHAYEAGTTGWAELFPGPLDGWSAPAAIRVEHVYAADEPKDCAGNTDPTNIWAQDLDGDGVPEQIVGAYTRPDCPQGDGYVLPRGFTGTVRVARDAPPAGLARYTNGRLVPDQDGDGLADTVYYPQDPVSGVALDGEADYHLYSGPMAEIDGLWQPTGPRLATIGNATMPGGWEPLWDIDGDGITDWLRVDRHAAEGAVLITHMDYSVIRGGADSLAAPQVIAVWATLHGPDHLVIPEEKAMLVPTALGFGVVDLSAL